MPMSLTCRIQFQKALQRRGYARKWHRRSKRYAFDDDQRRALSAYAILFPMDSVS